MKYLAGLPDALFVGLLGKVLPRESQASAESEDQEQLTINGEIEQRVIALLDAAAAVAGVRPDSGAGPRALPAGREAAGAGE